MTNGYIVLYIKQQQKQDCFTNQQTSRDQQYELVNNYINQWYTVIRLQFYRL